MSEASDAFEFAIRDAEALLARFDAETTKAKANEAESLKRAAMVMALAAWETYVKGRIEEEFDAYIRALDGSPIAKLVRRKLDQELKRFFNPNSERTKRLFMEFFEVDVTQSWKWDNYQPAEAKKMLDSLVAKRGDAAHRARASANTGPVAHLVKRDELDKGIRFLKRLVTATEQAKLAR